MTYRLFRWFLWSVLGSLLPFVALLVIRYIEVGTWPGLEPLFSSGQLLLTCVALLAGGIKELSGMNSGVKEKSKEALLAASVLFVVAVAIVYGYLANRVVSGVAFTQDQQLLITNVSLISLFSSLLIVGVAMAISAPRTVIREGSFEELTVSVQVPPTGGEPTRVPNDSTKAVFADRKDQK